MRIVADTGPLIGLAKIDCLFILDKIAHEVNIPPMVYRELAGKMSFESERIENALNSFIRVVELKPLKPEITIVINELDEGEKQAIGLASQYPGDVLLVIDDRAGRSAADILRIPTTGLIGVLLLAKKRGILKEVGALIDKLRNEGYWIADKIAQAAKRLAGE